MTQLHTGQLRKGVPLRKLWSAAEAAMVKRFVRDLRVQIWGLPYTEVDAENAVIYLPHSRAGGVDINAYFWAVQAGVNSVKVMAGATQRAGHDPVNRGERVFDDITEDSVIFTEYNLAGTSWSTSPAFLKIAEELPESTASTEYRPIAYITGEGEGTEEDPYRITEIVQAHVGVLREPSGGSIVVVDPEEGDGEEEINEVTVDTTCLYLEPEIALIDDVLKVRMKKIRLADSVADGRLTISLATCDYGDWGDGVLTCEPPEESSE